MRIIRKMISTGAVCMLPRLVILIAIATTGFVSVADGQNKGSTPQAPPPTKWDDHVLDVFFPDARQALVGARPTYSAGGAGEKTITADSVPGSAGAPVEAAVGSTYSWSKLISADTLQDEVKSLGIQLADNVKARQGFLGGGQRKARLVLSELAVVFAVINDYDGEVKWKTQAAAARDVFAKAAYNCKAATDNTFKEAKACSEDISALLRGENVKAPADVEAKYDWGKVAGLGQIMGRLRIAQEERISPWTGNAVDMKKNAAGLVHETELVAALAEVIGRPGFDNADDEKYHKMTKSLQQSAIELRDAVKKDDYAAATAATGNLTKACANCHAAFRD